MKNVKNSLLLLTLLSVLVLSMSSTFAQDSDNSLSDLAICDDDDSISIEDQDANYASGVSDDGYAEDSMSVANDKESIGVGEVVESMPQVDSGVVSGGVDYTAVNPWSTSGNLVYTVPEGITNVKSAIVIVNVYSGSGYGTYALYSNVSLNTNNGLDVLGYESLAFDMTTTGDANVYAINNHTTKQYSDYQMIYDITNKVNNLSSGDNITINVVNSPYPDKQFDGKIKLISLLFAYDDGDNDNYTYWLNAGQLWTQNTANFNFNTANYSGRTNNIFLRTIALSSSLASSYKINNVEDNPDSSSFGSYYIDIKWENIGPNFNNGSDTNFWFQNGGASYKTNVALLIANETDAPEPLTKVYVDYANGNDNDLGTSLSTAFKTIGHALNVIEEKGIIYISGFNYLDNVNVNGLTINKNISIMGLGDDATIDANNSSRIFNIGAYNVSLSNLAFVNANVAGANDKRGGALWVNGANLTIDNCKFINNTAGASSSYGGAINLKATATTIKNSYFENNSAFYTGAGINAEKDNLLLNISNCVFTANAVLNTGWATGGAICSYGTVIIDRSLFYGNKLADGKNGRSINEYSTGSLTITNSVLLDGKNSVWIATGPTTLENNWWGNNDTNKDINPKDLGYTNANVSSYLVLSSNISQDKIFVGDLVTITTILNNNVLELPILLDANKGEITPNETTLIATSTSTYTATDSGDVVITIDVLGIKNEIKLTIKETLPNVVIRGVTTPWSQGIYPAVNNTFTITLNNAEVNNVEGLVLEVYSNETGELIATYTIDSLVN